MGLSIGIATTMSVMRTGILLLALLNNFHKILIHNLPTSLEFKLSRLAIPLGKNSSVQQRLVEYYFIQTSLRLRKNLMKSYVTKDITDINFIIVAIYKALEGKWHRAETKNLINWCKGDTIEVKIAYLAERIQRSLILEKRKPDEYHVSKVYDTSTHKIRDIASTSMLSQIYHWIFVLACEDIFMKQFYVHQCASIPNRGGTYGRKFVKRWMETDHKNTKYCLKIDFKKCYQHIKPDIVMDLLKRKIRNKKVLWLAETILYSYDDGLPIGSVTSQWLCNFVISYVCHYLKEELRVKYCIFYMDDGCIFGKNKKELHRVKRELDKYCATLGLEIKSNWQVFRLDYIDKKASQKAGKSIHRGRFLDFMGYKFYRDHIEIRRATSLRIRRKYNKASKKIANHQKLSFSLCAGCLSYVGTIKYTDSHFFYMKYLKNVNIKILKEVVANESRKQSKTRISHY